MGIRGLSILALCASFVRPAFESPLQPNADTSANLVPRIDNAQQLTTADASAILNASQLRYCGPKVKTNIPDQSGRVTPWPPAPFTASYPSNPPTNLVFDQLLETGNNIQTLLLGNLVAALTIRIGHPYSDPTTSIVAAVPANKEIDLEAFLFEVRYPHNPRPISPTGPAAALFALREQILAHGFCDLHARIVFDAQDVGQLQLVTQTPLPIGRRQLPIIIAEAWIGNNFVEISALGPAYAPDLIDPLFDAVNKACTRLKDRRQFELFDKIVACAKLGDLTLKVCFGLAKQERANFFNIDAAQVAKTFLEFMVDFDPGDMSFHLFRTDPEYGILARGRIWVMETARDDEMPADDALSQYLAVTTL